MRASTKKGGQNGTYEKYKLRERLPYDVVVQDVKWHVRMLLHDARVREMDLRKAMRQGGELGRAQKEEKVEDVEELMENVQGGRCVGCEIGLEVGNKNVD